MRPPSRYSIITGFSNLKKELSILFPLQNKHIVQLHGVVLCPLGLILELAPAGSLKRILEGYSEAQLHLPTAVAQAVIMQVPPTARVHGALCTCTWTVYAYMNKWRTHSLGCERREGYVHDTHVHITLYFSKRLRLLETCVSIILSG